MRGHRPHPGVAVQCPERETCSPGRRGPRNAVESVAVSSVAHRPGKNSAPPIETTGDRRRGSGTGPVPVGRTRQVLDRARPSRSPPSGARRSSPARDHVRAWPEPARTDAKARQTRGADRNEQGRNRLATTCQVLQPHANDLPARERLIPRMVSVIHGSARGRPASNVPGCGARRGRPQRRHRSTQVGLLTLPWTLAIVIGIIPLFACCTSNVRSLGRRPAQHRRQS